MRFTFLPILFLAFTPVKGLGQEAMSLFDSLYQLKGLKLTLTYPFDSLYIKNSGEIESTISVESEHGYLIKDAPLSLNLRGKFRRIKCTMPPLLLNFKKSTLRELHVSQVDEIKLVTHCFTGPEGQINLQEERMCYQLYESITPYAYRTIWVNVTYCDASHPDSCITSSGFLLEPDKVITTRLGIDEKKAFNMSEDSIHFDSYSKAAAFNFLIGNQDWSVMASRNAKLFYDSRLHQYIVIPYDFDYSNIVGPSYRRETPPVEVSHPFDRFYQGEYFNDHAGEILKSFLANRAAIDSTLMRAENPMVADRRKQIAVYFDQWFDQIEKTPAKKIDYRMVIPYKGGL